MFRDILIATMCICGCITFISLTLFSVITLIELTRYTVKTFREDDNI